MAQQKPALPYPISRPSCAVTCEPAGGPNRGMLMGKMKPSFLDTRCWVHPTAAGKEGKCREEGTPPRFGVQCSAETRRGSPLLAGWCKPCRSVPMSCSLAESSRRHSTRSGAGGQDSTSPSSETAAGQPRSTEELPWYSGTQQHTAYTLLMFEGFLLC